MELRHKFAALALIYVASISANLLMSAWCILVYFQSAFGIYQSAIIAQDRIGELRLLVRRQLAALAGDVTTRPADGDVQRLQYRITALRRVIEASGESRPDSWTRIAPLLDRSAQIVELGTVGQTPGAVEREVFVRLERLLGEAALETSQRRQAAVSEAERTQRRVVLILLASAIVGLLLCAAGLVFVRRWVLRPVADLRAATREIARGNFEYRIVPRSRDELGQLAREVNQMAATIMQMQAELVDKERLAAAGEMVSRLAHNIRNPLAGVRGLVEATLQSGPVGDEVRGYQQRIINTLDQFEAWLRRLQQSLTPMTLEPLESDAEELVGNVITALQPLAQKRGVELYYRVAPQVRRLRVDVSHFEQALVALITNAIQASGEGQQVRVLVEPDEQRAGAWRLVVEDDGAGIAPELQEKIFLPYFTTRADGSGVGLPMAARVVRAHGGHLSVQSEPGQGSRFVATMPGDWSRGTVEQ